jgi:hypothetical protein
MHDIEPVKCGNAAALVDSAARAGDDTAHVKSTNTKRVERIRMRDAACL